MNEPTQTDATFRRILVPLDGSALAEHALGHAAALASAQSQILLLRVLEEPRGHAGMNGQYSGEAGEALRLDRQSALNELVATASKIRDAGSPVRPIASIVVGDPAEQIAQVAHERGYDLIVMSSHGRGAIGRFAFGSVADRVARTSTVPTLITRPEDDAALTLHAPYQRLVVPLDGSVLAARALLVAVQLAKQLDVPVQLVSVVDLWGHDSPSVLYPAGLNSRYYDEAMAETEAELSCMLKKAALRLQADGISVKTQTLRGPIAAAIMSTTVPGDIIVMTSHAKSGLTRFLLGSVAEKLVRESPAPVLLVPPLVSAPSVERVANVRPVATPA